MTPGERPTAITGTWSDLERHAEYVYFNAPEPDDLAEAVLVLLAETAALRGKVEQAEAVASHITRIVQAAEALDERMTRADAKADDLGRTWEQAEIQDALAAWRADPTHEQLRAKVEQVEKALRLACRELVAQRQTIPQHRTEADVDRLVASFTDLAQPAARAAVSAAPEEQE